MLQTDGVCGKDAHDNEPKKTGISEVHFSKIVDNQLIKMTKENSSRDRYSPPHVQETKFESVQCRISSVIARVRNENALLDNFDNFTRPSE